MEGLVLTSLCVLAVYLVYTATRYGMGDYVSDNFYISKCKWLFCVVMAFTAVTLLPAMIEKNEDLGALSLVCAFSLLLVASEPYYKTRGRLVHNAGAYTALVTGLIWVACFHWLWVIGVLIWFMIYVLLRLPKPFYVGEVLAFALIYLNLLL